MLDEDLQCGISLLIFDLKEVVVGGKHGVKPP